MKILSVIGKCSAFNGRWNIEVVKKSDKEVLDLAKYFCKSSRKELEEITTVRTPIFRIKRKNVSLAAYYKIRYAVDKIGLEIQNIKSRLSKLEQLYHRSLDETQEIESLRAKLAEYDDFYNKRCEKFYH